MNQRRLRVLMVCLGNICRSPTAEAVFRAQVQARGLQEHIEVDSAGTGDWHIGQPPDQRARNAARKRSYLLDDLVGRQVSAADFERFDYIVAMDFDNFSNLRALAPAERHARISLLLDHSKRHFGDVPDPYTGGEEGFELVLDLVEDACAGLLDTIVQEHGLAARS